MLTYLMISVIGYQTELYSVVCIIIYCLELILYEEHCSSHEQCLIILHTSMSMLAPLIFFDYASIVFKISFSKIKRKKNNINTDSFFLLDDAQRVFSGIQTISIFYNRFC